MFKKVIKNLDLISYDSEIIEEDIYFDEEEGKEVSSGVSNTNGETVRNKMLFLNNIDDVKLFRKSRTKHKILFNIFGMNNIYFSLNKSSDLCETLSDSFNKVLLERTKWRSGEDGYSSFTYGKLAIDCNSVKKRFSLKSKILLSILKRMEK